MESRDSTSANKIDPGITNVHLSSRDAINTQSDVATQSIINFSTSREGNPRSLPKGAISNQADVDAKLATDADTLHDVTQYANQNSLAQKILNLMHILRCLLLQTYNQKGSGDYYKYSWMAHQLEVGASLGWRHNLVRFQIWGYFWNPRPKLYGADFFVRPKNGLVWPLFTLFIFC